MTFKKASDVTATIRACDDVERIRGQNRVKVNELFNGFPPMSPDEARRWNLKVNVNWGEGPVLAQQARRQYYNAFVKPGNFFKVTLPAAPASHQAHWGNVITQQINRLMKKDREYFELIRSKFACVVAHGIGPQIWDDQESWLPRYVAIEDLRVPTDTEISLRNLEWFAERRLYTEGELVRKVWGTNSVKGWNKKVVARILKSYHSDNQRADDRYDWLDNPEKVAELVKQNLGYYSSDAVPTIPLWHFYHREQKPTRDQPWFMVVVPDTATKSYPASLDDNSKDAFIYESKKPIASDLSRLLHVQFGDLNNKAPFLWHSVRSLGFLLMEPCYWTNLLRCRFVQHVFETLNIWLRINDPSDRDRAQKIELFDRAVIPSGIEVIPQTQRHNIDPNLINNVMAQLRQLMSEASASYTQEIDTGTNKEQTATETMAKVSQVNAMMSGLLATAFMYESFSYEEICRRFCLSNSEDADVKEFQRECKKQKVPREWLNVNLWQITPEIPIGSGNPTMEMTQAQMLMQHRPMYSPTGQAQILHLFTEAATGNPVLAELLAPAVAKRDITDSQEIAGASFGALMQGVPPPVREDVSNTEMVEVLIGMLAGKITALAKAGNMATAQDIIGMQTVAGFIEERIQMISADETQRQVTRQFADDLKNLTNEIKGFAQRFAEEEKKKQAAADPAMMAKAEATKVQAQQQIALNEQSHQQSLKQGNESFAAEQQRKQAEFVAEQRRLDAEAQAEIERTQALTLVDIESKKKAAEAQAAAAKKVAAAKPAPKKAD